MEQYFRGRIDAYETVLEHLKAERDVNFAINSFEMLVESDREQLEVEKKVNNLKAQGAIEV